MDASDELAGAPGDGPGREQGCDGVRDLLIDHVDGVLSPSARRSVESHLAACEGCRREARHLAEVPALLGRLPRHEAPADLVGSIRAGLDAIDRERAARRRWARVGAGAAALAASFLAAAVAVDVYRARSAQPGGHGAGANAVAEAPADGSAGAPVAARGPAAPAVGAAAAVLPAARAGAVPPGSGEGGEAEGGEAESQAGSQAVAGAPGSGARMVPAAEAAGPQRREAERVAAMARAVEGAGARGAGEIAAAGASEALLAPAPAAIVADPSGGEPLPIEVARRIAIERARHEAAFALDGAAAFGGGGGAGPAVALSEAERAALRGVTEGVTEVGREVDGASGEPAAAAPAGPAVVVEVRATDRAAARAEIERILARRPSARLRTLAADGSAGPSDEMAAIVSVADLRAILFDLEGSAVVEVRVPPLEVLLPGASEDTRVLLSLPIAVR